MLETFAVQSGSLCVCATVHVCQLKKNAVISMIMIALKNKALNFSMVDNKQVKKNT